VRDEKEGDELVRKLEQLAKKKESEPPPELTNDVIINLAGMTPLQYAQRARLRSTRRRSSCSRRRLRPSRSSRRPRSCSSRTGR
jgi:hypothetical protein